MAIKRGKSRLKSNSLAESTMATTLGGGGPKSALNALTGIAAKDMETYRLDFITATGRREEDTNWDQDFATWLKKNKDLDLRPAPIAQVSPLSAASKRFKFAEIRGRKERKGKQRVKAI
jgi:hypothetical protein